MGSTHIKAMRSLPGVELSAVCSNPSDPISDEEEFARCLALAPEEEVDEETAARL